MGLLNYCFGRGKGGLKIGALDTIMLSTRKKIQTLFNTNFN